MQEKSPLLEGGGRVLIELMLVITTYSADSMLDSLCFMSGNVLRCLVPKIKMPTLLAPFKLRAKAIGLVKYRVRI